MDEAINKRATTISQRVRELRKQRGLLQSELAERAGLAMQTISNIEVGRKVPEMTTLLKLATALDVSLTDLL